MALNAAAKCHNQFLTPLFTLLPKFNIQLQLLDVILLEAICLILSSPSIPAECNSAPLGLIILFGCVQHFLVVFGKVVLRSWNKKEPLRRSGEDYRSPELH